MSALQLLPCEAYHPHIFSCWHDGPVFVLDTKCMRIDELGEAKYIACQYDQQVVDFLRDFPRPSAACIYVFMSVLNFYKLIAMESVCEGLDVRLVV